MDCAYAVNALRHWHITSTMESVLWCDGYNDDDDDVIVDDENMFATRFSSRVPNIRYAIKNKC